MVHGVVPVILKRVPLTETPEVIDLEVLQCVFQGVPNSYLLRGPLGNPMVSEGFQGTLKEFHRPLVVL